MDAQKQKAAEWFRDIRDIIVGELETLETDGKFEITAWDREDDAKPNASGSILKGGGETALLKGKVFEKAGVNISTVHGTFSEAYRAQIPGAEKDGAFWAGGISLVIHPRSPLVPTVHMNTRMIVTTQSWFGGGMDLTPVFPDAQDTHYWHDTLKACCTAHPGADYQKYKDWCDEYFFLPHRNEPRGVGGIFYDYLDSGNWDNDFAFTQDVGRTFATLYPAIVRRHIDEKWTDEQREAQLMKRGRYVEFNLLYDRGTQFGLKTGGNTDAILMSLPPEVKWP